MADLPTLRAKVEAAQALAAKATQGPWRKVPMDCGDYFGEQITADCGEVTGELLGVSVENLRLFVAAPDLVTLAADLLAALDVSERRHRHRDDVEKDMARQRDEARAELSLLRASLTVPERYAGIVSEAVAAELEREQALRCEAVKTADNLREELNAIRGALGNGADEAAWRPGETLAEAVGRLLEEWTKLRWQGRCGHILSQRVEGHAVIRRTCPLPAGHEGPHAEALGDNGGPNG